MPILPSADAWDRYWQSSSDQAAYCSEGISDAASRGFWKEIFRSVTGRASTFAAVDFCSGNGAVLRAAVEFLPGEPTNFCCIDRSPAAIRSLHEHFPGVRGIVCDARSTPFPDGAFMLVTSQFGIEYAGLDAVDEMQRLLAPGGYIALLLHHRDSPVSAQCRVHAETMKQVEELNYLPLVRRMFETAFGTMDAKSAATSRSASEEFLQAHSRVADLLTATGATVCGGTLQRLHADVSRMHSRIRLQDPPAVLRWLDHMRAELSAYAERMRSQVRAEVSPEAFLALRRKLAAAGMKFQKEDVLVMDGHDVPLAWALVATRAA